MPELKASSSISPKHPLFPEYNRAFLAGNNEALNNVRKRALKQVKIEQMDNWKALLKNIDPIKANKLFHSEACLVFRHPEIPQDWITYNV